MAFWTILAAGDGSKLAMKAVETAAELTATMGRRYLLHVVFELENAAALETLAEQ